MISAVIPAHNESGSIIQVLNELLENLSATGEEFEVIVVDDCSTDNTAELVRNYGHGFVSVIGNVMNMGYGFSLKKGIGAAKYDTIMIVDADGTYPLEIVPEMVKEHQKGFDLVIADRGKDFSEDSWLKSIFRFCLRKIVEFTTGIRVPDVNSGLRVFSRDTMRTYLHLMSDQFSFTTSMTTLYALDRKLILFKTNGYRKRSGKTKVKLRRDIFRTLQIILEIIALKNPLKLHMLIILFSVLLWVLAIMVFWVLNDAFFINLVSGLLVTASVQMSIAAFAIQGKVHNRTS